MESLNRIIDLQAQDGEVSVRKAEALPLPILEQVFPRWFQGLPAHEQNPNHVYLARTTHLKCSVKKE